MLLALSAWIVHVILAIGVIGLLVGLFLDLFPIIPTAKLPIIIVSVLIIAFGSWREGVISNEKTMNAKIAEANVRAKDAEVKAADASAKIQYVYVDRIQKVKDTQVVVQEKLRDVAVKIDSQCKITADTIDALNNAAKRPAEATK